MSIETPDEQWPRLRDLPRAERQLFELWLHGQTIPALSVRGVPLPGSEQDAYYPWDYTRWQRGLPAAD